MNGVFEMPKKMFVDPEEVRKPGKLSFTDIPMNVYQKPLEQEPVSYTHLTLPTN